MGNFLNDYAAKMNKKSPAQLAELKAIFQTTVKLVNSNIPRAFRLVRALNAAVYDSVMVGIATRVADGKPIGGSALKSAYDKLLANSAFRQACERATADEETVKARCSLAIEFFSRV